MKKIILFLLAVLTFLPVTVLAQPAETLTEGFEITLKLSADDVSLLTDGDIESYVTLPEGETVSIKCGGAAAVMFKWYETAKYNITLFDESGAEAGFIKYTNTLLNQYVPLNGAASLALSLPIGGKLSEIIFYGEGETAEDTQIWQAPVSKADVLVLAAHPDDEYLYMGGTIPYYGAQRGLNVAVVWMSHQRRLRQEEALAALWAMEAYNYPEFLGFPDKLSRTYANGIKNWGEEATLEAIVEIYRKYKPEAVVTHDLKGEYGHGAHMVTAALALEAATAAADGTQFPESAEQYGTWQIKKLYLHLYGENKIVMDWNEPLDAFGGKTALDMAKLGYSYHKSQHIFNLRVSDTSGNSCARFGLAFTTVGPDVNKNDFLENIPAECLSDYIPPGPEATPMPSSEPAAVNTPELTIEPMALPADEQTPLVFIPARETFAVNLTTILIIVAGSVLLISAALVIFIAAKKKRKPKEKV